jgi:hypothetical protein
MLSVAARCREPLAGKPCGIVGGKENGDAGDVVRLSDATEFPFTGTGDVNTYALFAELFSRLAGAVGRAVWVSGASKQPVAALR